MQNLVLEKTIVFKEKVEELLQVTIDDNIDYLFKSDGVLLNGKIYLNGEVKIKGEIIEFLDTLDVDIYAPFEKLADKKALAFKIEDFEYKISENKVIFFLKSAIDGWSDMKSTFPEQKSYTKKEDAKGSLETLIITPVTKDFVPKTEETIKTLSEISKNQEIRDNKADQVVEMVNEEKQYELEKEQTLEFKDNVEVVLNESKTIPTTEIRDEANQSNLEVAARENKVEVSKPKSNKKEAKPEIISDQKIKNEKVNNKVDEIKEALEKKIEIKEDIIIVEHDETDLQDGINNESNKELEAALLEILESKKPTKTPQKEEVKKEIEVILDDTKGFDYFNLFRNSIKVTTVFWRYRVVLKDDTYASIASEYKINEASLKTHNENKTLQVGMLIKIPI